LISWISILDFLVSRRGLLDAVVFYGVEPTLQLTILDACKLDFRVGPHTAVMNPECFVQLLPLFDRVGFDAKASFVDYAHIIDIQRSEEKALASLRNLLARDVPYEVNTTAHQALLSLEDTHELKEELLSLGVIHYAIQCFRSQGIRLEFLPSTSEFLSRVHSVSVSCTLIYVEYSKKLINQYQLQLLKLWTDQLPSATKDGQASLIVPIPFSYGGIKSKLRKRLNWVTYHIPLQIWFS
jgi:pyruvate formate lyase activating enzyme